MSTDSKKDKTPKELADQAKQLIADGFDRLGRSIQNPSILDKYLLAATYKNIRFYEAIIVLCEKGLTDEALSILRSLIENTINMGWIVNKDSDKRLKQYMDDLGTKGFGSTWADKNLYQRMKEVGFDRDYYDYCIKVIYSYAHVNSSSLIWGEVIDDPRLSKEKWRPEALYVVVAQMLGHVLKTLDIHFTDNFKGYDDIWKQIKVDRGVRRKFEKLRESLKQQ